MPDWFELHSKLAAMQSHHDTLRRGLAKKLAKLTKRNVILYYSGWLQKNFVPGATDFGISDADKTGFMTVIHRLNPAKGLDLILHTPGGDMAATESIIHYLHSIFGNNIRAIIPQIAMSGGAMIACACKEIIMGKQSNIGPFDPQINGTPSQAILEDLTRAATEMNQDVKRAMLWQPILQKYDLGFFALCKNAIKMADEVVRKSLIECMFKDDPKAADKAAKIIATLGSHSETKTHARHIHKDEAKKLGLNIIDLEKDPQLQDAVLSLHHACVLTFEQTPAVKIIENDMGKAHIRMLMPQPMLQSFPVPNGM